MKAAKSRDHLWKVDRNSGRRSFDEGLFRPHKGEIFLYEGKPRIIPYDSKAAIRRLSGSVAPWFAAANLTRPM
jgi:hypothetical protein